MLILITNYTVNRHLSAELIAEYQALIEKEESTDVVLGQALEIVPFLLKHNAEADAVDLLLELEALDKLPPHVDKDTYQRICLYLIRCVISGMLAVMPQH